MREKSKAAKMGEAIRAERQRCGYTPRRLADMLDADVELVKKLEAGQAAIGINMLTRLCSALRTTPDRMTAFYDEPIGIRTRLDKIDDEQVLTVYLNGWKMNEVKYCKSGNVQLTFREVDND